MYKKPSTSSEVKPESHLQKIMRDARRQFVLIFLSFGFGALTIAVMLYYPAQQASDKAKAELAQVAVTSASHVVQISTLQAGNATLQRQLNSATQHMYISMTLSGVRGASMAVAAGDYAGAQLSLNEASAAFDLLSGHLGTDQKDVFNAMRQSADQALVMLQDNPTSVQPVLDQLTKNLVQLEKSLFPNP